MSSHKAVPKFKRALYDLIKYSGYLPWMPDSWYLKLFYRERMKRKLNLANPQTFNEKLQWLKLYDRRPEYTDMVDKYKVRKFVADKIGEEYLIPLLGVWDKFDDIDFSTLPDQFVLKCNHDSGSVFICKDKSKFDPATIRKQFIKALRQSAYLPGREWMYKNVVRKIIAEKYMEDSVSKQLRDYKIFCFDGKPKALFVASDRLSPDEETKFDFFDTEYNCLHIRHGHPNSTILPPKPVNLQLMLTLASKLSESIPQVRVDFYEVDSKVYFGEMTFNHHCGSVPFDPEEWDLKFGEMITLPPKKR